MSGENENTRKRILTSVGQGGMLNKKSINSLLEADPSLSTNSQFMAAVKNVKGTNGITFLMEAAKAGNVPRLQELLSFGANVNIQDNRGKPALAYAVEGGHPEAVRFLMSVSDTEEVEIAKLRVNMRLAKIDVDLDPRSGFKGNTQQLRAEKATLTQIHEILSAAPFPRGGGSTRKTRSRKRKTRKMKNRR